VLGGYNDVPWFGFLVQRFTLRASFCFYTASWSINHTLYVIHVGNKVRIARRLGSVHKTDVADRKYRASENSVAYTVKFGGFIEKDSEVMTGIDRFSR